MALEDEPRGCSEPFIHPLPFKPPLLSTCYVPSTVTDTGDPGIHKKYKVLVHVDFAFKQRRQKLSSKQ